MLHAVCVACGKKRNSGIFGKFPKVPECSLPMFLAGNDLEEGAPNPQNPQSMFFEDF